MSFDSKDSARQHFATVDHVKPLSKGGTNAEENLRLAHAKCNTARGNGDHGSNIPLRMMGEYACITCRQYFVGIEHVCGVKLDAKTKRRLKADRFKNWPPGSRKARENMEIIEQCSDPVEKFLDDYMSDRLRLVGCNDD